jgi:outer membrane protein
MLKKILVAALCLLPFGLMAQDLKFGHVNSQEVLADMPQMKDAQTQLETLAKQYESELMKMSEEYEKKMKDFLDPKNNDIDPQIKQTRQEELISLERRIDNVKQTAQEQLQKKQESLIAPIIDLAKKAIKEIGEENKLIYVFDISSPTVVYFSEQSMDITPLLKKKLAATAPSKPATTAKPAAGTTKK